MIRAARIYKAAVFSNCLSFILHVCVLESQKKLDLATPSWHIIQFNSSCTAHTNKIQNHETANVLKNSSTYTHPYTNKSSIHPSVVGRCRNPPSACSPCVVVVQTEWRGCGHVCFVPPEDHPGHAGLHGKDLCPPSQQGVCAGW